MRYYDPETGRYITSDPIGLLYNIENLGISISISTNEFSNMSLLQLYGINHLYGYVGQNPLKWSDFFGLCPDCDSNRIKKCMLKCNLIGGLLCTSIGISTGLINPWLGLGASIVCRINIYQLCASECKSEFARDCGYPPGGLDA